MPPKHVQFGQRNGSRSPFFFGGHETFPFRYGWLKKSIDAISRDDGFFLNERAMIDLGVGKKMVQSIRYWSQASRLIEQNPASSAKGVRFRPTEIGGRLFCDDGFDPYMEDPGTLWLLHWLIASNSSRATTWFWMFSLWNNVEFTKERAIREIESWLLKLGHRTVSENSLRKDIDCFVRTYTRGRQSKQVMLEDSLDCPMVDLGLITEFDDGRTYQFQRGSQASLPDEVFTFALDEFWQSSASRINTLAFSKIAHDPGSPGRIFKLDEDSLASRLERLETITKGALYYDETSGVNQVSRRSEVARLELLEQYYEPRMHGVASR